MIEVALENFIIESLIDTNNTVGALLILHPTGILYTAQTAGIACRQREGEGFVIPLNLPDGYCGMDCRRGCWGCGTYGQPITKEIVKDTIEEYNEFLKKVSEINGWDESLGRGNIVNLHIDEDRLEHFEEGWNPVKLTFEGVEYKGFLHAGNCD